VTCNGSGACSLLPNGAACMAGNQCQSGNCPVQDQVCCNAACSGTCSACVSSKTGVMTGTCGFVTANQDPDMECAGPATCSGVGACN
jgi:hypothetical protein